MPIGPGIVLQMKWSNDQHVCAIIKACTKIKALFQGKVVHGQILKNGLESHVLGNSLVHMYSTCLSIDEACEVFERLKIRNVVSWNALIAGYALSGKSVWALDCFRKMQEEGLVPNVVSWNFVIAGYAQNGESFLALKCYEDMQLEGIIPNKVTILSVLNLCASIGAIEKGRQVQKQINESAFLSDTIVGNSLIDMYAKCGSLNDACRVFEDLVCWDVVSWNAMIAGCAQQDEGTLALGCFEKMKVEGITPNKVTFLAVLKACASIGSIEDGRLIHDQIIKEGLNSDVFVGSALVDMYAKCKGMEEANFVFARLPNRNVVSWNSMIAAYAQCEGCVQAVECLNAMQQEGLKPNVVSWNAIIAGYAQQGQGHLCLEYFLKMQQEGLVPNKVTFLSGFKGCASIGAIQEGRLIHAKVIKSQLQSDLVVGNTIVDMYANCGCLDEAHVVFNKLPANDLVSWNVMISAYSHQGESHLVMQCYGKMMEIGISPDEVTFLGLLKACAVKGAVEQSRLIHEDIIETRLHLDTLSGALVDMYMKCRSFSEAWSVFDSLTNKNVVVWNAMVAGCIQHGHDILAFECFEKMQESGIQPNVASLNAIIGGYSQRGDGLIALELFNNMQYGHLRLNDVTYLSLLKACSSTGDIEQGRLIHGEIINRGLQTDVAIGNSLVDMYAKCGSVDEASKSFNALPNRNPVSWGAMIEGYAHNDEGGEALGCFKKFQQHGVIPDKVIFLSTLKACANVGALDECRFIHKEIVKCGFHLEVVIGNTLVDTYAKCGCFEEAAAVFHALPNRNVISWGAMISGYAQHGEHVLALHCFQKMQQEGIKPNEALFTNILIALSRAGLMDEGHWYYKLLRDDDLIMPSISHHTCLIDLLGRVGCVIEAEKALHDIMPSDIVGWTSLLSACKMHGSVEVGRRCFNQIVNLDRSCVAGYVLMSNILADAHMDKDASEIKKLMLKHVKAGLRHISSYNFEMEQEAIHGGIDISFNDLR